MQWKEAVKKSKHALAFRTNSKEEVVFVDSQGKTHRPRKGDTPTVKSGSAWIARFNDWTPSTQPLRYEDDAFKVLSKTPTPSEVPKPPEKVGFLALSARVDELITNIAACANELSLEDDDLIDEVSDLLKNVLALKDLL